MKGIFYEIMIEASIGKVIIDDDDWPIAFNTIIEDKNHEREIIKDRNNATLRIRHEERFYSLLEKYIALELNKKRKTPTFYKSPYKSTIKWLMAYLFINATPEDFQNPEDYLERRIDFLQDNTFSSLDKEIEIPLKEPFQNTDLKIKNSVANTSMETPYKIDISLVKDDKKKVEVSLPSIYYGISNHTCYLYAMLTNKEEKKSLSQSMYKKKINRLLYKVNDKVEKEESLKEFEQGLGDYPEENITDVTHSFILSLTVFLSLLENKHIDTLKVVPYLPLRYLSREIAAENIINEEKRQEYKRRNEEIQNNLTNKLIRTVRRVAHQNPNIEVLTLPYEVDEYLTIKIHPKEKEIENSLLKEAVEEVEKGINR